MRFKTVSGAKGTLNVSRARVFGTKGFCFWHKRSGSGGVKSSLCKTFPV